MKFFCEHGNYFVILLHTSGEGVKAKQEGKGWKHSHFSIKNSLTFLRA